MINIHSRSPVWVGQHLSIVTVFWAGGLFWFGSATPAAADMSCLWTFIPSVGRLLPSVHWPLFPRSGYLRS